jgi:hypothetical protein
MREDVFLHEADDFVGRCAQVGQGLSHEQAALAILHWGEDRVFPDRRHVLGGQFDSPITEPAKLLEAQARARRWCRSDGGIRFHAGCSTMKEASEFPRVFE